MGDFSSERAQAGRWMYKRKDRPVAWWRWAVLTKHNPDSESLKLDDRTAYLIFVDFVHDGLLVPLVTSDGHEAYTINPGKDPQWRRVMHPWRYWFRQNMWRIAEWVISGVIGIALTLWWEKLMGK